MTRHLHSKPADVLSETGQCKVPAAVGQVANQVANLPTHYSRRSRNVYRTIKVWVGLVAP